MSSALTDLHPLFQPVVGTILYEAGRMISPSSYRPASTYRTRAEQAALKKSGASSISVGFHNFGLAFDVAVITPGGVYVKDGADWRYRVFGVVAEMNKCVWGGRWAVPDWNHIQYAAGHGVAQYMEWIRSHSA